MFGGSKDCSQLIRSLGWMCVLDVHVGQTEVPTAEGLVCFHVKISAGCGTLAEGVQRTFRLYAVWDCTHCGMYIQQDLGKHIAFYHMELAQLWRCPVMWCTVWKGTAQDCIDHMRRTHNVPLLVKVANLARFFPPWTVTREQWADMMMSSISGVAIDTLLFSRIGSPLRHRYRIISRTGSHAAFRGTYMRRLRAFLEELD